MKTTLDLPRPLLLRIASRAARMRIPVSRYVAESLERAVPDTPRSPQEPPPGSGGDPLFEAFREELGL